MHLLFRDTMATSARRNGTEEVRFTKEGGLITAIDTGSGVAACGGSKSEALSELADALTLHEGGGEPIEDGDTFLRELGIEPGGDSERERFDAVFEEANDRFGDKSL